MLLRVSVSSRTLLLVCASFFSFLCGTFQWRRQANTLTPSNILHLTFPSIGGNDHHKKVNLVLDYRESRDMARRHSCSLPRRQSRLLSSWVAVAVVFCLVVVCTVLMLSPSETYNMPVTNKRQVPMVDAASAGLSSSREALLALGDAVGGQRSRSFFSDGGDQQTCEELTDCAACSYAEVRRLMHLSNPEQSSSRGWFAPKRTVPVARCVWCATARRCINAADHNTCPFGDYESNGCSTVLHRRSDFDGADFHVLRQASNSTWPGAVDQLATALREAGFPVTINDAPSLDDEPTSTPSPAPTKDGSAMDNSDGSNADSNTTSDEVNNATVSDSDSSLFEASDKPTKRPVWENVLLPHVGVGKTVITPSLSSAACRQPNPIDGPLGFRHVEYMLVDSRRPRKGDNCTYISHTHHGAAEFRLPKKSVFRPHLDKLATGKQVLSAKEFRERRSEFRPDGQRVFRVLVTSMSTNIDEGLFVEVAEKLLKRNVVLQIVWEAREVLSDTQLLNLIERTHVVVSTRMLKADHTIVMAGMRGVVPLVIWSGVGADYVDIPIPGRFRFLEHSSIAGMVLTLASSEQQYEQAVSENDGFRRDIQQRQPELTRSVRRYFSDHVNVIVPLRSRDEARGILVSIVAILAFIPFARVELDVLFGPSGVEFVEKVMANLDDSHVIANVVVLDGHEHRFRVTGVAAARSMMQWNSSKATPAPNPYVLCDGLQPASLVLQPSLRNKDVSWISPRDITQALQLLEGESISQPTDDVGTTTGHQRLRQQLNDAEKRGGKVRRLPSGMVYTLVLSGPLVLPAIEDLIAVMSRDLSVVERAASRGTGGGAVVYGGGCTTGRSTMGTDRDGQPFVAFMRTKDFMERTDGDGMTDAVMDRVFFGSEVSATCMSVDTPATIAANPASTRRSRAPRSESALLVFTSRSPTAEVAASVPIIFQNAYLYVPGQADIYLGTLATKLLLDVFPKLIELLTDFQLKLDDVLELLRQNAEKIRWMHL